MYKTTARIDVRCPDHTRFHPERDGPGAVKAACPHCLMIVEIYALIAKASRLARDTALGRKTRA